MPISESACGLRNSMHHPGNAGSIRLRARESDENRLAKPQQEQRIQRPAIDERLTRVVYALLSSLSSATRSWFSVARLIRYLNSPS
jgi:hypothetical protein